MDLYPAIDVRDGRCVQLVQGDYSRETVYHDDPVAQARDFAAAGVSWIHVVDLDAARTGEPVNGDVIADIAASVDVPIQAGGGVRDERSAEALFAAGVARIVLGTAAAEDPELLVRLAARHPIAVGLDHRHGEIVVRGWQHGAGRNAIDLVHQFEDAGVAAFVVTEVGREGMLQGPDLQGLETVLEATSVPVIASGGVGSADDLRQLATLRRGGRRLEGAIVGTAIYKGHVGVADALAAVASA